MTKLDQRGNAVLLISFITTVILLIGCLIFAVVEYGNAQNYKNNVEEIAASKVKVAVDLISSQKDKQFNEALKSPLKTYRGPSTYGSIIMQYPKTYSGYVSNGAQSSSPVDGYFHPDIVPGTETNANYALRLEVTSESYDSELQQFDSAVQEGTVTVKPFSFPKVKGVIGVKVEGQIGENQKGTLILMPLRDKAIKVWTESEQFIKDFNTYVLPKFRFSP